MENKENDKPNKPISETFWKIVDVIGAICVGICIGNVIALRVHTHDKAMFKTVNEEVEFLYDQQHLKWDLIEAYDEYYDQTERFLDTLDNEYDWIDAFDPQDYYSAKAKIDSLYATQL